MNKDLTTLRAAIGSIASLLAGQGLVVTQIGTSAYVEVDPKTGKPKRVNIPHLGDNASEGLIMSIQGFIDHEIGHVLDTDWVWQHEVASTDRKIGANGMFHNLWNIVEDTYIERKMAARFPGTALNLNRLHTFFLAEITEPAVKAAIATGDRKTLVGYLLVPMARAWAGQVAFQDYMKAYWPMVADEVTKIGALAEQFPLLESTEDSFRLTEDLWLALNKPLEDEKKDDGGKGGGGGKGGEGEVTKGAGKAKGKKDKAEADDKPAEKPKAGGKGEDEAEGDEPEEKAGGKAEGDDQGDDDASGEGEAPAPGDEEGDAGKGAGDGDDGDEDEAATHEVVTGVSGGVGGEVSGGRAPILEIVAGSFEDAIAEKIGATAVEFARESDYRLFSTDWDVIKRYEVEPGFKDSWLTTMEDAIRQMIGVMQKDIERMMAARSQVVRLGGFRTGRLKGSALHRVIAGEDRVFERRQENNSKDVAVTLLVDNSGSMSGRKVMIAMQAALALSQTLERVGIKHEVAGFTTLYWGNPVPLDKVAEDEKKIGRPYSRVEPVWMPIFKEVGERLTPEVKKRFADVPHRMRLANNIDGESVEYAAKRLLTRKERRKVLLVFSDGQPSCDGNDRELHAHLRKVVKWCGTSGIECIGIGINSDAVRHYYPKSMSISDVTELPGLVMTQLKKVLAG